MGKKMTKRQRLRRDPMNQKRAKVRAWAKQYGAIVSPYLETPGSGVLTKTRWLFLHGFRPDAKFPFHPNSRVRNRAYR